LTPPVTVQPKYVSIQRPSSVDQVHSQLPEQVPQAGGPAVVVVVWQLLVDTAQAWLASQGPVGTAQGQLCRQGDCEPIGQSCHCQLGDPWIGSQCQTQVQLQA
jgi:hypothetical protein